MTENAVNIQSFPDNEPVDVAKWGGAAAGTPPLTDTQLRASAVPVSGTVTATGPLTDTQLRATPVPVSGPLTDTQLRATPVPVSAAQSGTWNVNNVSGTVSLPAGASTETTLAAVKTAAELIDDAVATTGIAVPAKGLAASGSDGTNARLLKTNAAGELQIDVLTLPALSTGGNNIGDVDVLTLPATPAGDSVIGRVKVTDGTNVAAVTAGLALMIDGSAVTQPVSGPLTDTQLRASAVPVTAAQGTPASLKAQVEGTTAHDNPSPNPVLAGLHAVDYGASPTAVSAADLTRWLANRHGIPFVLGGHPNIITKEFHFTALQTDALLVTASASQKIVVTAIEAVCHNANTLNVGVRIGLATATLAAVAGTGVTGIVLSHPGIAPGSGVARGTGAGILAVGAVDEDLRITSEVPTGGSLRVVVTYYLE